MGELQRRRTDEALRFMTINQRPPMPLHPAPIVILGTGGIVKNAHLPAYRMAGFEVFGLYDVRREAAEELAGQFGVGNVFASVEDAVAGAPTPCIFDIAVPAIAIGPVLNALPDGAAVLIQKPFGENLEQAAE